MNPASGFIAKDIAISLIIRKLRRHFSSVSLVYTHSPEQARDITRRGLDHFDLFVAFGGDGTVNSVATPLLNTNKTLGILPGGSGNGLARNLTIPLSWRRALDTLVHGQDVVKLPAPLPPKGHERKIGVADRIAGLQRLDERLERWAVALAFRCRLHMKVPFQSGGHHRSPLECIITGRDDRYGHR